MIRRLQRHASTIVITVTFYVSVFFAVANWVPLSTRQIGLGLIAGAIGGLFALVTKIVNERRAGQSALS
jgi:hypothetical protein